MNIDFFTMCINTPEILDLTYKSLKSNIDIDLLQCDLYLNVDVLLNSKNLFEIKYVAEKYFKNVIINYSYENNCNKAFIWGLNNVKKDFTFIIESNKCIGENFSINTMINELISSEKIVECALNPVRNNGIINYLTSHPSLWKTSWLKKINTLFSPYLNYEYQLRELGLLDNKIGKTLATKRKILKHIGKEWKDKNKYILGNSSTDSEIKDIIENNKEWHQQIYNIFSKKNNIDNNIIYNFKLKSQDKEWIYRWTGIWKYVLINRKNFVTRHMRETYYCNQNAI